MPTRAWSTPACDTSSTKRATSRRLRASYRVQPQSGLSELKNRGYGTGDAPKGERVGLRPMPTQLHHRDYRGGANQYRQRLAVPARNNP